MSLIALTQPRQAAPTVNQGLLYVLLRHLPRHSEAFANFCIGEPVRKPQPHRGLHIGPKLHQHCPQPRGTRCRIQVTIEGRQRPQRLVCFNLADIDAARAPVLERGVLLHQIVGDRIEVQNRIAQSTLVAYPQHAHVYLLRQIRRIRTGAYAPPEEGLQSAAVLGEQPLDQ